MRLPCISRDALLPSLAIGAALIALPAAGVIASSEPGDDWEDGPRRTSDVTEVERGVTAAGKAYAVEVSRAEGGLLCVALRFDGARGGPGAPVVSLSNSEMCVDPEQQPVAAALGQLFVDPYTGKPSDRPQRFVHGIAASGAERVVIEAPNGESAPVDLIDLPGTAAKAFAGDVAPGETTVGAGVVVAKTRSGDVLGRQPLRFNAPAHKAESEMPAPDELP
jgi:hypothetical protein